MGLYREQLVWKSTLGTSRVACFPAQQWVARLTLFAGNLIKFQYHNFYCPAPVIRALLGGSRLRSRPLTESKSSGWKTFTTRACTDLTIGAHLLQHVTNGNAAENLTGSVTQSRVVWQHRLLSGMYGVRHLHTSWCSLPLTLTTSRFRQRQAMQGLKRSTSCLSSPPPYLYPTRCLHTHTHTGLSSCDSVNKCAWSDSTTPLASLLLKIPYIYSLRASPSPLSPPTPHTTPVFS